MAYEFLPSQRGKEKLLLNGFLYRHQRSRGQTHYFRCEDDACPGTATLRNVPHFNSLDGEVAVGQPHNHDPEPGRAAMVRLRLAIKRDAQKTTAPPSAIIQQHRQDVPVKDAGNMPSDKAMRQAIHRQRKKDFPTEPRTKGEILLPESLVNTVAEENFVLFDTFDPDDLAAGPDEGDDRILAFGTRRNLEHLSKCRQWFLDGTFKSCPQLFAQLYTINGLNDETTFPFVYGLLPSKSLITYETFFRELKAAAQAHGMQLQPLHIMLDFEQAAVRATTEAFPGANVHACLFHLGQNIYRRVQSEGLTQRFREDEETNLAIKKLLALAFLPAGEIEAAFDLVTQDAPEHVFPVYKYFEDTYIKGRAIVIRGKGRRPRNRPRHPPLFPPELWSVYDLQQEGLARTNNAQEAWHRRFNEVIGRCHAGLFPTIKELRKEQHRSEQELRKIEMGGTHPRRVTNIQRMKDRRIQAIFENRPNLDVQTYIRRIARNMGVGPGSQGDRPVEEEEEGDRPVEEEEEWGANFLFP